MATNYLFVGKSTVTSKTDSPEDLPKNEIGFYDEKGDKHADVSDSDYKAPKTINVYRGGSVLSMQSIKVKDIKNVIVKRYVAKKGSTTYIGYNPTKKTGRINVVNSEKYTIGLDKHQSKMSVDYPRWRTYHYDSKDSGTKQHNVMDYIGRRLIIDEFPDSRFKVVLFNTKLYARVGSTRIVFPRASSQPTFTIEGKKYSRQLTIKIGTTLGSGAVTDITLKKNGYIRLGKPVTFTTTTDSSGVVTETPTNAQLNDTVYPIYKIAEDITIGGTVTAGKTYKIKLVNPLQESISSRAVTTSTGASYIANIGDRDCGFEIETVSIDDNISLNQIGHDPHAQTMGISVELTGGFNGDYDTDLVNEWSKEGTGNYKQVLQSFVNAQNIFSTNSSPTNFGYNTDFITQLPPTETSGVDNDGYNSLVIQVLNKETGVEHGDDANAIDNYMFYFPDVVQSGITHTNLYRLNSTQRTNVVTSSNEGTNTLINFAKKITNHDVEYILENGEKVIFTV